MRRLGDALDLDLDAAHGLEGRAHAREAVHEGADRVAAAARLELAQRHAGGLHGPGHERAERAAVVVEREARSQDLTLVAVAEGIEGGAVDAGRTHVAGVRRMLGRGRTRGPPPAGDAGVRRRSEPPRCADAERREPLLQLLGGLAVEGEHEDAGRVGAAVDELDDAAHECLGLARARRSQDARRSSRVLDGRALGVVEPRRVGAARGPARGRRARGRSRRRSGERGSAGRGSGERWRGRRGRARSAGRRPQQAADILQVQRGRLADVEAARREHLGAEREADAEREAAGDQRMDESQQDVGGLCGELLGRAAPVPEADRWVAAEQGATRLAGVLRPRAACGEPDARRGRRRSLREVAAARHVEAQQPGTRGRRDRKGGGVPVVGSLVGGGAHSRAGQVCALRPAGHRR